VRSWPRLAAKAPPTGALDGRVAFISGGARGARAAHGLAFAAEQADIVADRGARSARPRRAGLGRPGLAGSREIPVDQPLIVLSRHCGPGDSVLVACLLTFRYLLRVRVVLKVLLRAESVLDFAGDLECLCFLPRGDGARRQIRELAASLAGGQELLLFPEGANFSWPRWRAAYAKLRSTGGIRAARRAWRQSHTLPRAAEVRPPR
jgi:NAD(P)-dependent dehydrogenase (short-subunit alcohol dehydrogenase family)